VLQNETFSALACKLTRDFVGRFLKNAFFWKIQYEKKNCEVSSKDRDMRFSAFFQVSLDRRLNRKLFFTFLFLWSVKIENCKKKPTIFDKFN